MPSARDFPYRRLSGSWTMTSSYPRSLKKRPQKRFTFLSQDGPSERPLLLTEDEPVYGIPLPPSKFMVHVYRAGADYPERGGLLRTLSWIYLFKNYALKDWVCFLRGIRDAASPRRLLSVGVERGQGRSHGSRDEPGFGCGRDNIGEHPHPVHRVGEARGTGGPYTENW